ncbi:DNA-directed RNA polymerase I core subunit rpa12, variant 2 [Batrachochytrium dendrobatidis]
MTTSSAKKPLHSLVFCKECGSLLDPPNDIEDYVVCHCCATVVDAKEFELRPVVTVSKQATFPDKPKPIVDPSDDNNDRTNAHLRDGATIQEKCPKCDAPEMVFHTAQLRSADEGQTVFYSCVVCGYVSIVDVYV